MLGRLLYGKWEYLGWTQLHDVRHGEQCTKENETAVVHYYARVKNQKKRKVTFSTGSASPWMIRSGWYNRSVVPWLEGGDMWKPIQHPVAVRGTLINYLSNKPGTP